MLYKIYITVLQLATFRGAARPSCPFGPPLCPFGRLSCPHSLPLCPCSTPFCPRNPPRGYFIQPELPITPNPHRFRTSCSALIQSTIHLNTAKLQRTYRLIRLRDINLGPLPVYVSNLIACLNLILVYCNTNHQIKALGGSTRLRLLVAVFFFAGYFDVCKCARSR